MRNVTGGGAAPAGREPASSRLERPSHLGALRPKVGVLAGILAARVELAVGSSDVAIELVVAGDDGLHVLADDEAMVVLAEDHFGALRARDHARRFAPRSGLRDAQHALERGHQIDGAHERVALAGPEGGSAHDHGTFKSPS